MKESQNLARIQHTRIADFLLRSLVQTRVFDMMRLLAVNTLTVLNYHRIEDPLRIGFDTFKPNVSATQATFAQQMTYIKRRFNVITSEYLAAWLRGEKEMPTRAAIITFDDGYYDNLAYAYPVLASHGLPATIFLTTDFIGAEEPFYWDLVAYAFCHTQKGNVKLPITGPVSWSEETEREHTMLRWIELVKKIPEAEKRQAIQDLINTLNVSIPTGKFAGLYLNWDQVRELSQNGIEFGSHTASHPILTRVSLDEARKELIDSKKEIEEKTGRSVISFAYPNGHAADFSAAIMDLVKEAGMQVAFTLLPGPTRYSTVRRNPLAIRRVFLGHQDSFSRFVSKISGLPRLLRR